MTAELLGTREVAHLARLKEQTVRTYLYRGTMPEPDVRLGQSPGWYEETIRTWLRRR